MLRKIRISIAAVMLIGITLLFVGIGQQWWGWMAKIQFLPSMLSLNLAIIAGTVLLTLLLGRIYCSVICPLGIFQDLVNAISSKRKGKARRFRFRKENKWVRYPVLVLFIVCHFASIQLVAALFAPYSAYGRIVRSIVGIAEGGPVYAPLLIVAMATLVIVSVCAWIWGRAYCNTVCPVGTVLSLVSRFSIFKIGIDENKCVKCGVCAKKCKASCIDPVSKKIDYSRCIDCFDCIGNCTAGAISFKAGKTDIKRSGNEDAEDPGRRKFLATAALIGTSTILAKAQDTDGGLAPVLPKRNPDRSEKLVPFGAAGVKDFYSRCTACGLCLSACPNGVLRPSTDLEHLLQPEMGFETGYCRPECTACSDVCPTGALKPIKGEKYRTAIGVASVNPDLCVVNRDGVSCGNCSRHCPTGAIRMVPKDTNDPLSLRIPAVVETLCIGCGACENLCPSRPLSAITVNGLKIHQPR